MEKKYYAVVTNENENGSHVLGRFSEFANADQAAKEKNGKLHEFEGKQLEEGEDHKIRGKLIKDYSSPTGE